MGRAAATLLAIALAGCGGAPAPPEPTDPAEARRALESALAAWQAGEAPKALAERSPPIRVADEDWLAGKKLERFAIAADGAATGPNLRAPVEIKIAGTPKPQRVIYTVTTQPQVSIIRQDDY